MSFTPRTRREIALAYLQRWSAEYAAASPPRVLLTAPGSDAALDAEAVAVELEGIEVAAAQASRDIIPTTASDAAVARFGYAFGVDRYPGSLASYFVAITNAPPLTEVPIPAGTQMATPDGVLLDVIDTLVVANGSGNATLSLKTTTVGAASIAVGTALTFTIAPTGLQPTGTVSSVDAANSGANEESYSAWARHIVEVMQEKPASGNRAWWREVVKRYVGTTITNAFVYPLVMPDGTTETPGCLTVVAIGPAQGTSATNTRVVPANDLALRVPDAFLVRIMEYIEGDRTATGAAVTDGSGEQLRPAVIRSYLTGDWGVYACGVQTQDVVAAVTVSAANAFEFTSTPTVHATSDTTHVRVTGDYTGTGIEDLVGLRALVDLGTANYRGGFYGVTLGASSYDGGSNVTTFLVSALPAAPVAGSTLYPAPGNWSSIRDAAIAFFDALGPGDTAPPSRWPPEDNATFGGFFRSKLYRNSLGAALFDASGVLSASITTPGADVAALPRSIVTLGSFRVTP